MEKICTFPGCGERYRSSGLCNAHYRQSQRGRALTPLRKSRKPTDIPFDVDANGCHVYRGTKSPTGYGVMRFQGKQFRVHRFVWARENGPIPDDKVIDHICRNRLCCNIEHLRLVTIRENVLENSVSLAA